MGTIDDSNGNDADPPVSREPTNEMQALMDEAIFGDVDLAPAPAEFQDQAESTKATAEFQDETKSTQAAAEIQVPMDEDEDLFGDDDDNDFGLLPIHLDALDIQESTPGIQDSTPDKELIAAPAAEPQSGGFSVELLDSDDGMDMDYILSRDQALDFEPSRPTTEVDQVLKRIPNLFRILELYKDSGCSGLVDKIIIAQGSVKELCNQLVPGSFKSISNVDFQRLSEVKMKLVGVYGNRESLAAMLLKLDTIDQQIFEMLTDAVSNSEASWLKPGLYFLSMKESTGIVILWPEQGCFYDDASSDLKKNLVNLHSFMYKLTHTQICLLSREDVNSINWEAHSAVNEKDGFEMDFDEDFDVDNGGIFEFKVTKNQEKERNFRIRDGFRVTHRAICLSLDSAVPAPSRQQLAFITTQSVPSQRITKKFDDNYGPDELQQFFRGQTLSTLRFADSVNRDEFQKFVHFLYPAMADKEFILQPLKEFDAALEAQLAEFRAEQESAIDLDLAASKAVLEVKIKSTLRELYPSLESMISEQENAVSGHSPLICVSVPESAPAESHIQPTSGQVRYEQLRKPALFPLDESALKAKLTSINRPKWKAIKERLMLSEIYSSHLSRESPEADSTKTLVAICINSRNRTVDNVLKKCSKRLESVTGVPSYNFIAKVAAFVRNGPPTDAVGWFRCLKDELDAQLMRTSDSDFVDRAAKLINATISANAGIEASGVTSDRKVEDSHVDVSTIADDSTIAGKLTRPAEDTYASPARMATPCVPNAAGGQCEVPTTAMDSTSPGHNAEESKLDLKLLELYDLQAGRPVSIKIPAAEFKKLSVKEQMVLRCKTILAEILLAYSEWRSGFSADGLFLPNVTKARDLINSRAFNYRREIIQKNLPAALATSKQILAERFGIGRLILIKSVGDERYYYSRYPSARKRIHVAFEMEMSKPALVKYSVWKGNLDANDAKTLEAGEGHETFVPTPRFTSYDQIEFDIDPLLLRFRCAYILKNGNVLLFLQEIQSCYTLAITGSQDLRHRVEKSTALKIFKRPISHISFDESKSLLALYDSESANLNVMCFDEGFTELFIKHPQINIGAWYNGVSPDIFDVIFIPTSEEVCFVEKSGRVRIYSLVTTEFRPSAFVLPPGFIRVIATNDGSCLMAIVQPIAPNANTETDDDTSIIQPEVDGVYENPARTLEAHIFFCTQPTSAADIIVPLPSSFTPEVARSVEMINVRNRQLHLTAVYNGAYVSVIAEVSLERHCWQFQENRKVTPGKVYSGAVQISTDDLMVVIGRGTQFLNDARVDDHIVIANNERRRITAITSDAVLMVDRPVTTTQNIFLEYRIERRAGRGGLLDVYKNVFTKFPVQSCLDRDVAPKDRNFIAAIPIGAQFSCEEVGKYTQLLQRHMKNSFEDLRKITTKDTRSLNNMIVSLDGYSDVSSFISAKCEYSEVQTFGDWLVRAFCLIPIQISMATQNRFVPLRDGVVSQEVEQPDIGSISEAISFGWYESIITYYSNYQVKVVSSMGEQSSGKSFMLNHLLGTSFDGSAMRCTEGAWMSMIPKHESKTIYVGLDFEGLQSIERSHQEDAILTVFNCATSSLVLMKTNFTIGRDANAMFSRFQDGANLFDAQNGKKLFTSKLALIIKDVPPADREGVVTEFKYKIAEMVAREGEDNFITRLHGNGVAIVPYPIFNDLAFFTHLIKLQNMLDAQKCKYQNALIFSKSIKVLMAKLKVCDWSGLDANLINMRCAQLHVAMPCAVGMGLEEMEPYPEVLKNKDTGTEVGDYLHSTSPEDAEKVEDESTSIFMHQLDTGLKLYEVMELSANKEMTPTAFAELLANFASIFDSKKPRSSASSDTDWFKEFCEFLTQLVDRRSKRVHDWLAQNTERFPADNVEVTNLSYTVEQSLTQLKIVWTLCGLTCGDCDYRCLLSQNHSEKHSCMTDHECKMLCCFQAEHGEVESEATTPPCGMKAGHEGDHLCSVSTHLCGEPCIHKGRRNCQTACSQQSNHKGEHLCQSRTHFCGASCSLRDVEDPNLTGGDLFACANSCIIPVEEEHDFHRCENQLACPIKCPISGCPHRCQSTNHFHALESGSVHQCASSHRCQGVCESEGICRVEMQPQTCEDTYINSHGSFSYTKFKQVHQRLPCSVMIPPNEIKHSGLHIHTENPDDFHFCHQRCPFCNYFCTLEVGHQGEHDTSHGSMEQTVFTNADEDEFEYGPHKFNRNDSGKCFLCQLYCKELKRHAHIDWCRHPDDSHLCDRDGEGSKHIHESLLPDPSKPKDYVTHETCWKRTGFKDPYSEEEKKFFSLCDAECSGEEHKPGEGHDPFISLKSYCRLPMFHAPLDPSIQPQSGHISRDGHQFGCSNPSGSVAGFHLVFALDRSGSMESGHCGPLHGTPYGNRIRSRHPDCFGAAIDAAYRFCVTRNSAIRSGVDSDTPNDKDIITLITFDHNAQTICSGLANFTPNSILDTLISSPRATGGTSFHSTVEAIRASVTAHYDRDLTPIIIFLSDGEDSMPMNSLSSLVRENNARGQTIYFYAVLFSGYYGGCTVLQAMAEFVEQNQTVKPKSGSTSGFYQAIDEVKLSEHFTGLADSLKTCKPSLLKIGGGIGAASNLTLGRIGGQRRI